MSYFLGYAVFKNAFHLGFGIKEHTVANGSYCFGESDFPSFLEDKVQYLWVGS